MGKKLSVVSFGEVLFDVFPDRACLGGAPLNLAVHLHRQGAEVTLISALGNDELGRTARAEILRQGLSDRAVASLERPTGSVQITLDAAKVPSYVFTPDCAYDHIPYPADFPAKADLFCFGTLAQRGAESRATLKKLLAGFRGKVFCDVNLRQNFFSREILNDSLAAADLVKLNDEELPVLAKFFGIPASSAALAEKFHLETVIETLGPRGCKVWHLGKTVTSPACPAKVVSTVGAGDSFSAAFLCRFLTGGSMEESAAAGNRLAAEVASQQGAF